MLSTRSFATWCSPRAPSGFGSGTRGGRGARFVDGTFVLSARLFFTWRSSRAGQGCTCEPVRLLVPNMFMNWLRNPGSLGFPHHTRTSNRSSRFTRVSEPTVRRVARNRHPGAISLRKLQLIPLCFWPRPVRPLAPPPPPATAARRCPAHPLPIIDRTGWLLVRSAVRKTPVNPTARSDARLAVFSGFPK